MINLFDTWRRQRRIATTRRHLHGLSDHILSDIGIARSDISSVIAQGRPRRHSL